MVILSGSNVVLGYVLESTPGSTPSAPTLLTLRATERRVNLEVDTLESDEVRTSRQISDVRHGFNRVVGTPTGELSKRSYDNWIQYSLGGTWSDVTASGGPNYTFATAGDTITRSSGVWGDDGFRAGHILNVTATANNNGRKRIKSVDSDTVVSVFENLTDEGPVAGTIVVQGKSIDVGKNLSTVTLERQFQGSTWASGDSRFQPFRGVNPNIMSMTNQPGALPTIAFELVGMSSGDISASSVAASQPNAPDNTTPYAQFAGGVFINGALNATVTGLNWNINNQRSVEGVIGSKFSPTVFDGTASVRGELSLFFQDETEYTLFFNETEFPLFFRNGTRDGDFMNTIFPRCKALSAPMDPPGSGPITLTMPFQALEDTVSGSSVIIQRSNS